MKNKKKIIIIIASLLVIIASFFVYRYFTKVDDKTTLTILEKQWIEKNKNNLIDLSIPNDVPLFTSNGEGIFFDFLNDLAELTSLEFNKIPYQLNESDKEEYSLQILNKVGKNDILIYQDNYALITKQNVKYNSYKEIPQLTIGVLQDDATEVSKYLNNQYLSYKIFENESSMIEALNTDDENKIDGIIGQKNMYFLKLSNQKEYYVNYDITEMNEYYVFSLGENKTLNKILTKFLNKWITENYESSFNNIFLKNYFASNEISEKKQSEFRSKQYIYGFVENEPYDVLKGNKLFGINKEILSKFSLLADIEIINKKYDNYSDLLNAFNSNKVDVFFNTNIEKNYDLDVIKHISNIDEKIVILSPSNQYEKINSLNSLNDKSVLVLKNSLIEKKLKSLNISVKSFDTINKMMNKLNNNFIAIDYASFVYYSNNNLRNYKIDYIYDLENNYNFISRDIKKNQIFNNLLSFYISYFDTDYMLNEGIYNSMNQKNGLNLKYLLYFIVSLVVSLSVFLIIKNKNKKTDKKHLTTVSKDNKIRYIDNLTSLKNRNYLNDNIDKWDNSDIYPQAIIIIDLNNIAYINDNYGHQEGDNVIGKAANILIQNQKDNTDIIRTDGNEFLIYSVGYDEKEIISYTKKIEKEMKDLDHSFGATIGYSLIVDGIKTVDDAINEATQMMKDFKKDAE